VSKREIITTILPALLLHLHAYLKLLAKIYIYTA